MSRVGAHNARGSGSASALPGRVTLKWRVGDEAARHVLSAEGPSTLIEIELRPDETGSAWESVATVVSGGTSRVVIGAENTPMTWNCDESRGLLHIDAGGVVNATFDLEGDAPLLLYARTGMLSKLGLLGGRYEIAGGEITPAPRHR